MSTKPVGTLVVRPMTTDDLDTADHIMRTAFGTFLGAPDPVRVFGDAQYVRPRFAAEPGWAYVAELEHEVVGSVFATRWGSFGFFGPLTVRHDLWDQGIARRLMEPVIDLFDSWQLRLAGLHTFAQSTKHVGLYQRFGFWPQYLTAIMAKPVGGGATQEFERLSVLTDDQQDAALRECAEVTDALFQGLDVAHDIRAVVDQGLGDTVLIRDGSTLSGFAVCHCGAGEAGSGTLFVKFAAVHPGPDAQRQFDELLMGCERLANELGLSTVVAGVNTARHSAYVLMLGAGYKTRGQGVRMHRPDDQGYCTSNVFVIDDLR